jgi:predicted neuraminidase
VPEFQIRDIQKITREPSIVHCSSIISTADSTLHCVWYQGSYETSKDTKIMASRRSPDGADWSEPEILFDFNGIPLGNPVLWSNEGTLYITFSVLLEESWESSLLFFSASVDNGIKWSAPTLFLPQKGFMPKTQPIRNDFGDILFPLYHESDYCPYVMIIKDINNILFSPLVAETMARNKAIQPALCKTGDNQLLMLCRTNQGSVWKSISYNDGYSWSICEPTELPNPDSALDVIQLSSGRHLLVSNPSSGNRHNLRLSLSSDNGETWSEVRELVGGSGEYSYPCLIEDGKGNVQITYTEDRYIIRHIEILRRDLIYD